VSFLFGVMLFAFGIGVSIALHEAGHMYSAKAFGMRVRRYFIGFGPTLFSFRRGETEYGLKAIPAGGFCDIAGMTALDELPDPEDRRRAFFRYATWKRVVVLSAGSMTHFVIGILLVYLMAITTGLPNLDRGEREAVIGEVSQCIGVGAPEACAPGDLAPAKDAGLLPGDRVLSVAGEKIDDYKDMQLAIQESSGPTEFLVDRNGVQRILSVDIARVAVSALGGKGDERVGAIGIRGVALESAVEGSVGPGEAVGETFFFTGTMFENTWDGLMSLPSKMDNLLDRIGGEDDKDTPVSVVGASVLGGDAVEQDSWIFFLFLLAALNFFVGVFNLLPLLPLDGGHIAVNLWERGRNMILARRGLPAGPPIDYTRLLPVTYFVGIIMVGFSILTLTADVINPIRLE
jgi:membrane-associated protease RseP (regulator of RpoE activity)